MRRRFDLAAREQPSCSRLFGLVPCGLDTGLQESLPSYLDRLARLHGIRNFAFMWHEIHTSDSPQHARFGASSRGIMLSGSRQAERIASLVAMSTGVRAVADLIQPALARCISLHGSGVRPKAAWCPLCFSDWARSGTAIYRPLLWAFTCVRYCPHHHILLQEQCGGCSWQFDHYGANYWPHACPNCGRPLSEHDIVSDAGQQEHIPSYDEVCSSHFLELLSWATGCDQGTVAIAYFQRNISTATQGRGNSSNLCRLAHIERHTLNEWLRGHRQPWLPSLLRLSYCFDVPLHHWFSRLIPELTLRNGRKVPESLPRFGYSAAIPLQAIEKGVNGSLAKATDSPPSLTVLARALGVTAARVARCCPHLVRRVVERYAQACMRRKEESYRRRVQMVRDAIAAIRATGHTITRRAVIRFVRSRGVGLWERDHLVQREILQWKSENLKGSQGRAA